mmetsp:Transcript_34988/g.52003  ORF Transcript_34988/g.52003 Transcript_34988/m.52003 type:complete len:92 (+) Transcript_34988:147-422(+)
MHRSHIMQHVGTLVPEQQQEGQPLALSFAVFVILERDLNLGFNFSILGLLAKEDMIHIDFANLINIRMFHKNALLRGEKLDATGDTVAPDM